MPRDREAKREEAEKLKCITPTGIATFVHVWEPFAFKKGGQRRDRDRDDDDRDRGRSKDGNYSLMLVFDGDEDIGDIKTIVQRAAIKKFGKDEVKRLMRRGKFSLPWRDAGDYEEKYGEPFEEGKIMISAKSSSAPGVVDKHAKAMMKQQDFYPGCKARMSVYAHAFDTNGNQGVTLLLNNVQKIGEGKRIAGSRMDAEDEFEPVKGGGRKGGDFDDDLDDMF